MKINPNFQQTFVTCLREEDTSMEIVSVEVKKPPKKSKMEDHAREKWSNILLYVVNQTGTKFPEIQKLLERCGLVSSQGITEIGFQFLLKDTKSQIWMVLQEYLNGCEKRKMDKSEVLQFLFELSFLEVGKEYSTQRLTVTQQAFVSDLGEFGIIYQKSSDTTRFYPTIFATGLIDNENSMDWTIKDHGHIIIETNFRIYAYTSSPLQISILDLFSELEYRTPNLVVGSITRESVRFVYSKGVTSDQIIDYVFKHAHYQMRKKSPVIPETITDQIRLWEKEKNRLRFTESIMWADFPSSEVYKQIEAEAHKQRIVLFSDPKSKVIVSTPESMENMRELFRLHAK